MARANLAEIQARNEVYKAALPEVRKLLAGNPELAGSYAHMALNNFHYSWEDGGGPTAKERSAMEDELLADIPELAPALPGAVKRLALKTELAVKHVRKLKRSSRR